MDAIIVTPRLKLTLITKAERGSPELKWIHELRSDEKATWWSIYGRAKSLEDTEKAIGVYFPTKDGDEKPYSVVYGVHRFTEPTSDSAESEHQPAERGWSPTEFIGLVALRPLDASTLVLPEHLTLPTAAATTTLTVELAYMLLPIGWGKGYATESTQAVLEACKRAKSFWAPFSKLYVRAGVNDGNPASQRVMGKVGMVKRGFTNGPGSPSSLLENGENAKVFTFMACIF